MALTRSYRAGVLGLATFFSLGCGTQYSDPIRKNPDETGDVCVAWTTEAECRNDTAHDCSFQPNNPGCHASDPACPLGTCRSGDPFVRRTGRTLSLHGEPYRFLGTVSWGITWSPDCQVSSLPDQEAALARTFDELVDMRAAVLKVWAFQSYAGSGGADYSSFDRVVEAARRAGVRLVFVLENHYPDCTRGATRDDAWYASGYASPYDGYALSLPDYARGLAAHFRDEPTLFGWQLMHEARGDDFAAMNAFAANMAQTVRQTDPNHLIVLGVDNGDSDATSRADNPSNYQRLHEHAAVDMMDAHDFFDNQTPLPDSLSEVSVIAAGLDKPIYAGATSISVADAAAATLRGRASAIEQKLEAAFDAGFVGFLVYDYYPDWTAPSSSFDARPDEPLAGPTGVLARHAPPAP